MELYPFCTRPYNSVAVHNSKFLSKCNSVYTALLALFIPARLQLGTISVPHVSYCTLLQTAVYSR